LARPWSPPGWPRGRALAAPGDAGAGDDAYAAALKRAIAAKERALDANDPARWEDALHLMQEAAWIHATRESAYEIGFAAERLSRVDLAVEAYEDALDLGLVGVPRAHAEAFISAHAARMARLDLRGPAGARVRIAGVDRGRLPLRRPLVLFPGEVAIDVVDGDGRATPARARLEAGHLDVLEVAVARPPVPAAIAERAGAPPAGAPPPSPPSPSARRAGAWLIGAGAVLAVAAAVAVPVAQSRLDAHRTALQGECATALRDDFCEGVKTGELTAAQGDVDGIATWKAVRIGAWVGAGVGLGALATGLVLRFTRGADGERAQASTATLSPLLASDAAGGRLVGLASAWRF
jgi:hypothetical protein